MVADNLGKTAIDKNRIDTLLRLADFSWRDVDTRRSYEWKINFGLWGAFGLLAGASLRGDIQWPRSPLFIWITAAILILVCLVYIFGWIRGLYERQTRNQAHAHHYLDMVEEELQISTPRRKFQPQKPRWPLFNWSVGSQIVITVLLAALAFFSILEGGGHPRSLNNTAADKVLVQIEDHRPCECKPAVNVEETRPAK
jgi:NADH:ubiquinone oxidoreductase subunit 5 (subunit L)/multisubunit Na+/H+ antiporter MnhA subunit